MTEPAPPPPPRPAVSTAASWLAALVGLAVICTLGCIGLGTSAFRVAASNQAALVRDRVERQRERAGELDEAEGLLDEIAQHIQAVYAAERAYPHALREAPPADPWGQDLRYERAGADWARLTSAGPDGRFDSADDLVRTLTAR